MSKQIKLNKLETSENNMICLVPIKPIPKELQKRIKRALKVS